MGNAFKDSFLSNLSPEWVESLYQEWRRDPGSVPREWQFFFRGYELSAETGIPPSAKDQSLARTYAGVQSLVYRYRDLGHLMACTDPLSHCQLDHPLLNISAFGLDDSDLDTVFTLPRLGNRPATLRDIIATLRQTYCREIGVEFMHIQDPDERQWLIDRMESNRNHPSFTSEEKVHFLECLIRAVLFEHFLHRRFLGQKRFSLEGSDVLIPALDALVRSCAASGISDVVMGMSHRGRLNVLAHILGKPYEAIFSEFRDGSFGIAGEGDVKYHRGYSSDFDSDGSTVHLTLAPNPSHLEAVNPVVEGKCRGRQDRLRCAAGQILPLLIHGDAAFAGQGSVMETLNMSQLEGYRTGGTIHIVLNNQIGFTTLPRDARSTRYATDVAKMLACPIFHVQGEAPESAVHAMRLALEYRQAYGRDVVVELICYRRHGHNEGDEPAFTQPLMYRKITERPSVERIYADSLIADGLEPRVVDELEAKVQAELEGAFQKEPEVRRPGFQAAWAGVSRQYEDEPVRTGVPAEKLLVLARRLAELPAGFVPHPKVSTLLQKRFEAVLKGVGIDWGNAETLAYATLVDEQVSVRLSGQDSPRGTFNHRHSVLHDIHSGQTYMPLAAVAQGGAEFQVWSSLLSEFGVLGFEYGYSLETPHGLTIWEAQFGDFANGGQVIIDQFISSGEIKWSRASGLVMLLPHGYEGQGAEHSSARIERFMQLCARENMYVANPTAPAQLFHLLRRQVKQSFRKPMVIFSPKSLLRHPRCVSSLEEFCSGGFSEILVDVAEPAAVRHVLVCSGKIFYELLEERERRGRNDVALIRIEQLYPFRDDLFADQLARLPQEAEVSWVQEEPENMGAWPYLRQKLIGLRPGITFIGRPEDSCPAVASHKLHVEQQAHLISAAFGGIEHGEA